VGTAIGRVPDGDRPDDADMPYAVGQFSFLALVAHDSADLRARRDKIRSFT
jgi:hypothetical protein